MEVIVGTTNTDGSGSAANLTADNGTEITSDMLTEKRTESHEEGSYYFTYSEGYYTDDFYVQQVTGSNRFSSGEFNPLTIVNTAEWNADGLKEVLVSGSGATLDVRVENFVDVAIYLHTDEEGDSDYRQVYEDEDGEDIDYPGVDDYITVLYAKRGVIDTTTLGDEDGEGTEYIDNIMIYPKSNGSSWSNLFEVTTGNGDDEVCFIGIYDDTDYDGDGVDDGYFMTRSGDEVELDDSSKWTEFTVDLGMGDDLFQYSLAEAASSSQVRYVDGGEGLDTINLYRDTADLDFSNIEYITNTSDEDVITLTISEEQLAENENLGVHDILLEFSDDYDSITATETSNNHYTVTVTYDDASYTISTNVLDSDWLLVA